VSLPHVRFQDRREKIAGQIAQQRHELAEAYRDLGKPLKYTQAAVKGVQVIRENAWLLALSPSVVGLVFSFLGWKKEKPTPKLFGFFKRKKAAPTVAIEEEEGKAVRKAKPLVQRLIGHGVTAVKLYRKLRPFLPL
jgi:hypothetical protein